MEHWFIILSSIGTALGAIIAIVYAAITSFRDSTTKAHAETIKAQSEADKAREDLATVLRMEAEAWKNRYVSEHQEFLAYREEVHAKAQVDNKHVIQLTTENATLKTKTDLTPVLSFQKEQTAINEQILESLKVIATKLSA